jgi:hypothetical protein
MPMDNGAPREGVGKSKNFPKILNLESVFLVDQNVKNQKYQNIKSVFLVDHNYENQNVEKNIEIQTN